jgi:hypothetical protein
MTISQKKRILEISVQRVWRHHRGELRRIFVSCEDSGYSVDGYVGVLEDALKVARRAVAAIDILESSSEQ